MDILIQAFVFFTVLALANGAFEYGFQSWLIRREIAERLEAMPCTR